jgi:hypothetical protein
MLHGRARARAAGYIVAMVAPCPTRNWMQHGGEAVWICWTVLENRRDNDGYGGRQAETGSIVQPPAPMDDGGLSDIGSRWKSRTRAAGSQEAEGRCTLGGEAMCNVQRTGSALGGIWRCRCRIEGPNTAALTAAMHCPWIGWMRKPNRREEPAPGIWRRQRVGGTALGTTV